MNILFISTTYPTPVRPRQGAFNRTLIESLRTRHDVQVIAPVPWPQAMERKLRLASRDDCQYPVYYYPPKVLREQYHRFYWQSIRRSVKRIAREYRPDIVMSYWLHPDGAAALRAASYFGVPSIVMSGGTDLRLLTSKPSRCRAIEAVLEQADRVVVFSNELRAQADRLGVPPDKIDVVYRGVDRSCFHNKDRSQARVACNLPRDGVVVLWAGRLEAVKNPHLFLAAVVHWKKIWGDRLHIVMAGAGPLGTQLRHLCRSLGLDGVVHFAGNLSQGDLALHLNAADVTVLTSSSEGIPNVLLESIACGTPFVATDVGGVSEIASAGVDRLVPPGNLESLVAAVIQHIRTPPSGARSFVPTDLAGMAEQLEGIVNRTLGSPVVPAPKMSRAPGAVSPEAKTQHMLKKQPTIREGAG